MGDGRNDVLIHQNWHDSTYGMDPCVSSSFSTQLRQLPASLRAVASAKDKCETHGNATNILMPMHEQRVVLDLEMLGTISVKKLGSISPLTHHVDANIRV